MLRRSLVTLVVLVLCERTSGVMAPLHAGPHARLLSSMFDPAFVGADGGTFSSLFLPSGTPGGGAVFRAQSAGFSVQASDRDGQLHELARTGVAAPGAPDGVQFEHFVGAIAAGERRAGFIGVLSGPGVDETNNHGIWRADDAGVHMVVRAGDAVPGLGGAVYFAPMFSPLDLEFGPSLQAYTTNPAGAIGFQANLIGPDARDGNDRALFVDDPAGLRVAARRGDPAPGAGPGATFGIFFQNRRAPSMNGLGEIAFNASIEGGTALAGIFAEHGGEGLRPVVMQGSPAPQAGAGVAYDSLSTPSFNDAGETAFRATLTGPSVGDGNNVALFAGRGDSVRLVAREGDPAPGTDARFDEFNAAFEHWVISGSGRVAFVAHLNGPTVDDSNDSGLWVQDRDGSMELIAREGDAAPGGGAFGSFGVFSSGDRLHANSAGQIAFQGRVRPAPEYPYTDSAIWATDRAGSLHLIASASLPLEFESPDGVESVRLNEIAFPRSGGGQDGFAINLNERGEVIFMGLHDLYTRSVFVSYAATVPEPTSLGLLGFAVTGLISRFGGLGRRRLLRH